MEDHLCLKFPGWCPESAICLERSVPAWPTIVSTVRTDTSKTTLWALELGLYMSKCIKTPAIPPVAKKSGHRTHQRRPEHQGQCVGGRARGLAVSLSLAPGQHTDVCVAQTAAHTQLFSSTNRRIQWPWRSILRWVDLIAKLEDHLKCSQRCDAVVFLLALRQLVVGHQTRMMLLHVIAPDTASPALC